MQINRLFEIIYLLLNKKSMTAKELADRFEVSKRTILRDVDTLAAAKIPIYTMQGKGGGISLMDGFVLNKTALTEDEQNQILLALQSLGAVEHAGSSEILAKLGALFQKANVNWIEVDFSRWGQGAGDNTRFELLKSAILSREIIQFEYVSSYGENSSRKVCPLKLVFKSKVWYMQGFCADRKDYRTFKINRMLGVTKTDESFEADKYTSPPIENSGAEASSLVKLELVFPSHVAHRVYDEFEKSCIEKSDNGSLHVTAQFPEDNWLYSFLLSFGRDVAVISPLQVKEILSKKRNIT